MKIKLTKDTLTECLTNVTDRIIKENAAIKKTYSTVVKKSKKSLNENKGNSDIFNYIND